MWAALDDDGARCGKCLGKAPASHDGSVDVDISELSEDGIVVQGTVKF
jgi:hypothetical protein